MRLSRKAGAVKQVTNQITGISFRDQNQMSMDSLDIEAAPEFGIVGKDLNKWKQKVNRHI